MPSAIVLVVPDDLARPTGGNRYDQELARAVRALGVQVEERPVAGAWPVADPPARRRLADALTDPGPPEAGPPEAGLPDAGSPGAGSPGAGSPGAGSPGADAGRVPPVLVDGLLACGAPEAVEAAVAAGVPVHVLVHMPLGARTDLAPERAAALDALERRTLHAATGVLTTSRSAADGLRARHGLAGVVVAVPGARLRPPVPGPACRGLLRQVATVSPVKDQLTVLAALALLRAEQPGLPWTAELTGLLDVDPGYTEQVRAAVHRHGLADRVRLTGPLDGPDLDRAWTQTDLLLLPSRTETWGLVVTEALARGIPAVVSRGTGAQEALGSTADGLPGALVPPGDPAALVAAVRHLLGPGWPAAVRAAALRRTTLTRWPDTAREVLQALRVATPAARPIDPMPAPSERTAG